MAKMNAAFLNLKENYLFKEISKQVNEYTSAHPDNKLIKMGIGDVTLPLAPVVVGLWKRQAVKWAAKRPSAATRTAVKATASSEKR